MTAAVITVRICDVFAEDQYNYRNEKDSLRQTFQTDELNEKSSTIPCPFSRSKYNGFSLVEYLSDRVNAQKPRTLEDLKVA